MKKIFIVGILALVLGIYVPKVNAQVGSMMGGSNESSVSEDHSQPIEAVLAEVLSAHGIDKVQDLDCTKVTDDEFEKIGDSFMEKQHPGDAHESMDEMMGGEGSESLKQIHISMGQGYLGCSNKSGYGMGGFGMMGGGGMMGSTRFSNSRSFDYYDNNGFSNMMGYNHQTAWHYLMMGITWLAGIGFLVTGTLFFIKNLNRK